MRTQIALTRKGFRINMTDLRRRRIERLGAMADQLLKSQNPLKWAALSEANFLSSLRRGAAVLAEIGLYSIIDLTEADVHCAFMACRFLALEEVRLSAGERRGLQQVLLITAKCCLVEIEVLEMPTVEQAAVQVPLSPRLISAYRDIQRRQPVFLAMAAELWIALNKERPGFRDLLQELGKATLGLRTSLLRLRDRERRVRGKMIILPEASKVRAPVSTSQSDDGKRTIDQI